MGCSEHSGLLQPDQHVVRNHHRVLYGGVLPSDECRTQIRGGQLEIQNIGDRRQTQCYNWTFLSLFSIIGQTETKWRSQSNVRPQSISTSLWHGSRYATSHHWMIFSLHCFKDQLDDETLFPSKIGVPFPPNFQVCDYLPSQIFLSILELLKMLQTIAKTILKRLFRVYAHIYHQHFKVGKTF